MPSCQLLGGAAVRWRETLGLGHTPTQLKIESSCRLPTAGVSTAIDMQYLTRYLIRL